MVELTEHAILRYIDRVKPCANFAVAKDELTRLAQMGERVNVLAWAPNLNFDFFVLISDGIALGVEEGKAVSLFIRGGMADGYREHRRRHKKERRRRARAQKAREQIARRHGEAKRREPAG